METKTVRGVKYDCRLFTVDRVTKEAYKTKTSSHDDYLKFCKENGFVDGETINFFLGPLSIRYC